MTALDVQMKAVLRQRDNPKTDDVLRAAIVQLEEAYENYVRVAADPRGGAN